MWYLPLFGVYHPKKPNKIRVVFDSSAPYEGVSLNSVLLTGPDLNNSLLGVLMRFLKEPVAIIADIQHMFHCFLVREDHKDYIGSCGTETMTLTVRLWITECMCMFSGIAHHQ